MKITSKTNKADLVAYAAQALGAQLDESKFSRDELIAEVRKLEKSLGIASDDAGDDDAGNEGDTGNGNNAQNNDDADSEQAAKKNPRFVYLRIHTPPSINTDEDAEEETHCIVGFNGKNYQIQYDVEEGVKVPYGVYDVLKNAVQTKYRRVKGKREMEERKEQRYKFNVVKTVD